MNLLPHIILETANFHGGSIEEIEQLIDNASKINYENMGIKFHAFKHDRVALPDFSWYEIVKKFFIDKEKWKILIKRTKNSGLMVWLDLFCTYGVEVLEENLDNIYGIKLQPSILDNYEIISKLGKLNLTEKRFIINVSGLEISEIEDYLKKFSKFNFKDIIIQLGFQNFPTKPEDSSLNKIDILKTTFPKYILSYADHIDAESSLSQSFPLYAYIKGCSIIEKHVCNNRKNTEYDKASALEVEEIKNITKEIQIISKALNTPFVSENEKKYYEKGIQKPIIKEGLNLGQAVSIKDIHFKRTDKDGLNHMELKNIQNGFFLLNKDMKKNSSFISEDFKKAKIAVIIAARMKSSRLKKKAILPIEGVASINRCINNCKTMNSVQEVILATSTLKEDKILEKNALDSGSKFWQGDPDDVIERYLGACDKYGIDVIVRVTGDCPVISSEIAEILLKSHFESGADFTAPNRFSVGTNSEIYNVEALRRVIKLVGKADYSEHMTLYMTNNPDIFKVNKVDLPQELIRDYRLTLDYQEDLDMFEALYEKLKEDNLTPTLPNIFNVLDNNLAISNINKHKTLVYKTDKKLIELLNQKTTIGN